MKNYYKIEGDIVVVYLKNSKDNITGEALINIRDLEKVQLFPNTWRLQKLGERQEVRGTYRVEGIKKQVTLAKWILDFPTKPIYFNDGDSLNLIRENLSFKKPLKGNEIITNEGLSYIVISRRNEEDIKVTIDSDKIELISSYTWVCDKKSDINDYVIYTKIYEGGTSRKISLRKMILGYDKDKTAYFVNGNRLDFRLENIKLYSDKMTNDYYIEEQVAHIFIKISNEETYTVTMIDEEDLEKVMQLGYTWHYYQGNGEPYIVNTIVEEDGKRKRVYLHRIVNDCPEDKVVDHINHDTLDNRKSNLRNVSISANQQNRKGANKNSLSGIRNVNWDKTHKDWIVTCGQKYIMRTKDFEEAKLAAIRVRSELLPYSIK
ncbi:hypothetical protein QE429_002887 [Bacillus sp. SORGH_AS 510]|uniref:HNH endonuclease n=1 Tax=Bacillus sp. SORGH_AS_0510 TaxID=3041771 RepID=UPI00278540D3|nr:HNH endonuclease [Bacillus sp. SORGH_AS_0510]MDQ1146060.1 hypothetical protein [Bacillus sp. SORGH_AS_0510]